MRPPRRRGKEPTRAKARRHLPQVEGKAKVARKGSQSLPLRHRRRSRRRVRRLQRRRRVLQDGSKRHRPQPHLQLDKEEPDGRLVTHTASASRTVSVFALARSARKDTTILRLQSQRQSFGINAWPSTSVMDWRCLGKETQLRLPQLRRRRPRRRARPRQRLLLQTSLLSLAATSNRADRRATASLVTNANSPMHMGSDLRVGQRQCLPLWRCLPLPRSPIRSGGRMR